MPLLGRKKVDKAIVKTYQKKNNQIRAVFFQTFTEVVIKTPVDSGRARGNWFLSVSTPSNSVSTSENSSSSLREVSSIPKSVFNKRIFLTNNLPYVGTLEYGGFPSPVKLGTKNKRTGKFEIRSISGFSKQRPSGWVRKALVKAQNKIRKL